MKPLRPAFREDLRAWLVLAASALLVFSPWLFAGQAFYWGDTGLYFLPLAGFLRHNLQQGVVPLWNPYLLCGTPFVGNPQTWAFYPSTVLQTVFDAPQYLMVDNVIHIWLSGAGLYLFLRRGRTHLDFYPALFGAVVYMLGGFLVSKTQFPNMVQALAYVPLVLFGTERLLQRPSVARAVFLGLVFGLQILAAHAQISVLTFYLTILYVPGGCLERQIARTKAVQVITYLGVAGLIALGLSCVFWLPVLELMGVAARQDLNLSEAHRFHLLPREITNLWWPLRFGSPLSGDWRAPGNFWEKACYMGVLPGLLGLRGAVYAFTATGTQRRSARFWLLIFLASILLALGWQGGLFLVAYYSVPGIKLFHDPARMLLGASIAVPVLAAFGMNGVLQRLQLRHRKVVAAILLAVTVADLGLFAHLIYPLNKTRDIAAMNEVGVSRLLRSDGDVARGRARVFFADPNRNRQSLLNYRTYFAAQPEFLEHWAETMMPNLGMLSGVLQAGAYEPVAPRTAKLRAANAENALPIRLSSARAEYSVLLSGMSVKYLMVYGPSPLPSTPGLVLVAEGRTVYQGQRTRVYRNTRFVPRARWQRALSTQKDGGIVEENLQSPNVMQLQFASSPQKRYFILTDSAYAGWRAYLNGREVEIAPTTDGFRRVAIAPQPANERNTLVFVYRPATFTLALFVSLVTLGLLSSCFVCRRRVIT